MEAGFIMVALLVGMAVAAIWMAAALPAWRHQVTRQHEAELIFRGEQIARAIYLYWQKNGQTFPASLDVLVAQKFLRKKYKDPITGKDFMPVLTGGPGRQGGVIGVRSTSNEASIRIYNNQQTYSQFGFDYTLEQLRSGAAPAPNQGGPGGGRGGPGRNPGPGGGREGPGRGGDRLGGPGGLGAPGEMNPIVPGRGGAPGSGGAQPPSGAPPFGIGGGGRGR